MRPSAHVISVIATLAFAAAPALAQEGPDAPPPVVVVASATAERMAETVTVPGSVVSRSDSAWKFSRILCRNTGIAIVATSSKLT